MYEPYMGNVIYSIFCEREMIIWWLDFSVHFAQKPIFLTPKFYQNLKKLNFLLAKHTKDFAASTTT